MLLENNPYPSDVRVRREAESLVQAGHVVCVTAPRARGQPRREQVRGVEVRRFRAPAGGDGTRSLLAEYLVANVALHVAAARELARGATVVHLHNPPDTLFLAGLVARALGRRVVFDHHDLFPELVETRLRSRAWTSIARAAERATFAAANVVLAANESHAEIARTRGAKAARNVCVVRNGPVAASVDPAPSIRGGRLADPRLVYLGEIAEQDGVELLADVFARLRDIHGLGHASLTVIGDGPARPNLEARLAAAGVADRVHFTGWLDADRVWEHLRAADICVDPAPPSELNHSSTMVKIAEYLAAGKPVVAYALRETARTAAGAAELVPGGEPAALAAAVAGLAGDPTRRAELARLALARARDLTWERSARELLAAYERL
jgi:glycosyltransferase involved in cell wall biosynthesis